MKKSKKRSIRVIGILLMLSVSPLSVTYTFADMENNQEVKEQNRQNIEKDTQKERLGVILTEKVVNGELKVQHYSLPDDTTKEDIQRLLSSDVKISNWAYVNYKAYHSGIVLFDGKASKVGENQWKISSYDVINLRERQFDLGLSEKIINSSIVIHENALDKDLSYKVIFSGKMAETYEDIIFAISILNLSIKSPEISENIQFPKVGESNINSENINH